MGEPIIDFLLVLTVDWDVDCVWHVFVPFITRWRLSFFIPPPRMRVN